MKFIYGIIDRVYESLSVININKFVGKLEEESSRQSSLLRALNHENNPTKNFKEIYGEEEYLK